MARLRRIDEPDMEQWLATAAASPGIDAGRAARLDALAGGRAPAPDAVPAQLEVVAQAYWDGGPMVLLPDRAADGWEGADPPSGGRVVDSKHRWDDPAAPATDYDLACEATGPGRAALTPAGRGRGLVTPTSWAAVATASELDGFFVIIDGTDPLVARWALTDDACGWRSLGRITTEGVLCLQSAALRGGDERGARIEVAAGQYEVQELAFADERGELHLLRARRMT